MKKIILTALISTFAYSNTTVIDNGQSFNFEVGVNGFKTNDHVQFFIDADNNANTGYLNGHIKGADYMIEDNRLFKSLSSKWKWQRVAVDLKVNKQRDRVSVNLSKNKTGNLDNFSVWGYCIDSKWTQKSRNYLGEFKFSKTNIKPVVVNDKNKLFVDSKNGDDNFGGTSSKPFKTIQAGLDHLIAGQSLFVKAGEYNERLVVKNSGTKNKPIVIEGERDANSNRLVTIFGGDLVQANWQKSNLGNGVYETRDIPYASFAMTIKQNGVYKDIPRLDRSYEVLAYPSNKKVTTRYPKDRGFSINFWDGIEALYAYKNGTTYIRFRDGKNPNNLKLYSSVGAVNKYGVPNPQNLPMNEGATIKIENKSYITIKGFKLDGSQNGVLILGKNSSHNLIEDNDIANGQRRVFIAKNAHHNYIKNNKLHMRLLSNFRPAAWWNWWNKKGLTNEEKHKFIVAQHYYEVYKYEVGYLTFSPLDDCGVFVNGAGAENEISHNEIYDTLGGVLGEQRGKIYIHDNTFHHISSLATGLVVKNTEPTYIYNNKMYDVNIGFRVQLNVDNKTQRYLDKKAWFFNNIIYNPKDVAISLYVYNKINPVDPKGHFPTLFFYHNTIAGGMNPFYLKKNLGKNVYLINNIFSDSKMDILGALGVDSHNIKQKLWNLSDNPTTMPTLTPPSNSQAIEGGIDLSKAFTINGKNFQALPFMKAGYFKGTNPNMGAMQ